MTVPSSYWRQLEGSFSVRPGQVNEWTLPLPDELLNAVREQLERPADPDLKEPQPSAAPEGFRRRISGVSGRRQSIAARKFRLTEKASIK